MRELPFELHLLQQRRISSLLELPIPLLSFQWSLPLELLFAFTLHFVPDDLHCLPVPDLRQLCLQLRILRCSLQLVSKSVHHQLPDWLLRFFQYLRGLSDRLPLLHFACLLPSLPNPLRSLYRKPSLRHVHGNLSRQHHRYDRLFLFRLCLCSLRRQLFDLPNLNNLLPVLPANLQPQQQHLRFQLPFRPVDDLWNLCDLLAHMQGVLSKRSL